MRAKQAVDRQVRLKKDIVIPAGTVLGTAPRQIGLSHGHFEHTLAMGKDNFARLIVFLEHDSETAEWLEPVNFDTPIL